MSKRNEKVYVKTEGLIEMPTAFIIGDLSIVNLSQKTKRHWGYGGYGHGYGHGFGHGYGHGYGHGHGHGHWHGHGYGHGWG